MSTLPVGVTANIFRFHDWLKTATGGREFTVEVFGNFLLRDNRTGELENSHGFNALERAAALGSGLKEEPDNYRDLETQKDVLELAHGLISGSATKHFQRLEESDNKTVIGLVQISLCCDSFKNYQWLRKYKSARIYDVESG